jgi:hypothetical protein
MSRPSPIGDFGFSIFDCFAIGDFWIEHDLGVL